MRSIEFLSRAWLEFETKSGTGTELSVQSHSRELGGFYQLLFIRLMAVEVSDVLLELFFDLHARLFRAMIMMDCDSSATHLSLYSFLNFLLNVFLEAGFQSLAIFDPEASLGLFELLSEQAERCFEVILLRLGTSLEVNDL